MAKYFVTFVLLVFLAFENKSVYKRLHVRSESSDGDTLSAHYMRQQHHNHLHYPRPSHDRNYREIHRSHYQRSDHHNRLHLLKKNADSNEDEAAAALHRYIHLQRHVEHQLDHQKHHQEHYHRDEHQTHNTHKKKQQQKQIDDNGELANNLKTMPRLWQHLKNADIERMYADSPLDYDQSGDLELVRETSLEDYTWREKTNTIEFDDSHEHNNTEEETHISSHRCPKCESTRRVEHISREELTRLRIEYVKQQILEKLRLKERPNVSAIGLPKPIYEGTTIEEEDDKAKTKDFDDYYARTSKKFIFLQKEQRECQRLSGHPSMCFSFKIDDADADGFDVNTAVLWIFKNKQNKAHQLNSTRSEQQTIVVSEVQQQLDSKYLPIVKTIAIQTVDVQDEWMKIDIEWPIKRWFGNHDLSHLIHISCQSCDISSMDEMISVDKDYRPFIMVDTQNRRRVSRRKRGINCTDGVTECCREKLYISFDEIGWGDWIIQPRGYDAYFCRGSCSSVASVTQSSSHHSTFLQRVLSTHRNNGRKPLELIPCCTAKQYSSLQLVFMDSNNTATQKTFPNMVVESCGCR